MEEPVKKEYIIAAAKNYLATSDFEIEHYSVKAVSDKLVGFMGKHLLVSLEVKTSRATQTLSFFVKTLPSSESHRSFLAELRYFKKEIAFYEVLKPIMSAALPMEHPLPVPTCYFTSGSEGIEQGTPGLPRDELIVLEDITKRGYRIRDKMTPFDMGHCRVILRCLARFHSASFLLQMSSESGGNAEYVEEVFLPAKEMLLTKERAASGYQWAMATTKTTATAVAGLWPERFGSREQRDEVVRRLRQCWAEVFLAARPSEKYFNVLCHGDVWVNNFMFKYERQAERPVDALLVDLQLIRFVPAAFDLLLFLHTSTTRQFRDEQLESLLDVYHEHLGSIVGRSALDGLMSREALGQSLRELAFFGKIIATAYLPFTLNMEEVEPFMAEGSSEPPDFSSFAMRDRGQTVLASARVSEMYKRRLTEAYQEILEHMNLWQ